MVRRLLSFSLMSILMATATSAGTVDEDFYGNIGLGGEFGVTGYEGKDPRFVILLEAGNQWLGGNLSFSFGQDIFILGIKPRLQYVMAPFPSMPNLRLIPSAGPVINWWSGDVLGENFNIFEMGIGLNGGIQYIINDTFNIIFTPLSMDMNFYRYLSLDGELDLADDNLDFALNYNVSLSLGAIF